MHFSAEGLFPNSHKVGRKGLTRFLIRGGKQRSKLGAAVNKARDVVGIARTLKKVLPDELAKKVERAANLAEQGLEAADQLAGTGQTSAALDKAEEAARSIEAGNPVYEMVARAAGSFSQVLGPAVPGLAVASVLVSAGGCRV